VRRVRIFVLVLVTAALAACGSSHIPASARSYKDVFQDWYDDGRFERPHTCTAVREAIRHLPSDPATYSTIWRDLHRLERRECG
jgi:hypothetical protein